MGLPFGVGCVEASSASAEALEPFFFCSMLEATFFDLGAILGGFGRPKWRSKSIFGEVFWQLFFACDFSIDFGRFLEAPNPKNRAPASTGARFSQNRRFQNMIEKSSILEPFLDAKTMKIR